MQATKLCIFCQGNKLTKEHFWPDWSGPLFPQGERDERVELSYSRQGPNNLIVSPVSKLVRPGRVITKKLRIVCGPCNSTWMSQIEEAAKPILLSAFHGKALELNRAQQRALAEWAALKMIISEYSKPNDWVTSMADRVAFRQTRKIPDGVRVWLGM